MTYFYVKGVHIIFVVTWFAGLFYLVRLFIYNREAQDKPEVERSILQQQFSIMIRRLWFGITWPSCILTLIFGGWLLYYYPIFPTWLWLKLGFVMGLLLYHLSLQVIYQQQIKNIFKYSSNQLRIWNEVATIFLVAIVMLVIVRSSLGLLWGVLGLIGFTILLFTGIKIYKNIRVK
jgi:protoporphyrinogen IX oxidase